MKLSGQCLGWIRIWKSVQRRKGVHFWRKIIRVFHIGKIGPVHIGLGCQRCNSWDISHSVWASIESQPVDSGMYMVSFYGTFNDI